MSDTVGVMHAAFQDYQQEEIEKSKKPIKKKVKEPNVMWQNLQYLEE